MLLGLLYGLKRCGTLFELSFHKWKREGGVFLKSEMKYFTESFSAFLSFFFLNFFFLGGGREKERSQPKLKINKSHQGAKKKKDF